MVQYKCNDDDATDVTTASDTSYVEPLQPFFNWVGSKRRYCDRLAELMPANYDIDKHTYFEPFLGSGSFLLFLQPMNAVVGDLDENVIKAFLNIRDNVNQVIKCIQALYKGNVKQNYVNLCKNFSILNSVRQTATFIFISKHSFGSNIIYNKDKTGFTLCYRNKVVGTDCENITDVSRYLKTNKVSFKIGDFRTVTKGAKKNDFIFLDPPYVTTRKTQKQYYNDQTDLDIEILTKEVLRLHRQGCYVLLVNSDSRHLRNALQPYFKCKTFKANEKILGAHKTAYTGKRKECIYTNY